MKKIQLLEQYDSIKTETSLIEFVDSHSNERESLHLEYKINSSSKKGFTGKDRGNFSENLSAFSNSEGGLLIWGISDYKKEQKAAERLQPIEDVVGFERRLRSSLADVISPMIQGFQMEVIRKKGSKLDGYIKCYIPESDLTPHQAFDSKYYMSTVEGVYAMKHFQVADMFGKRQRPDLTLNIDSKNDIKDSDVKEITIRFKNEGRAMARYYGYFCKFDSKVEIISVTDVENSSKLNSGIPTVIYTNNVGVIHPNGITYNAGSFRYRQKYVSQSVKGKIIYYCEHMITKKESFEIEGVGA